MRSASAVIEFEDTSRRLDVATWSLAAVVGADRVARVLIEARPKTATEAASQLQAVVASLSDHERAKVAERLEAAERARAERALWDLQTESITNAASAGMLDALILATGEHADWAVGLIDRSLEHFDVSRLVIDHALNNKYDHYFGLFHNSLLEHVPSGIDQLTGHVIDAGISASVDTAGHALSAIADAHLPVVTIFRSVHRASKSTQAGLDSGRVNENLVLDLGLKGGGIATGAALGTALIPIPIVGTVIGGILGSLLGGSAAEQVKERHFRTAIGRAAELTANLGRSIKSEQWQQVAARLTQHRDWIAKAQSELVHAAEKSRRGLRPPLGHFVLAAAAKVGAQDVSDVNQEHEDWLAELNRMAGPDDAVWRGVFALTRPDLHERLRVNPDLADSAMGAQRGIEVERQNLALARG